MDHPIVELSAHMPEPIKLKKECLRLQDAAVYALGCTSAEDRLAFESHLSQCASCAAELSELAETLVAIAKEDEPIAPIIHGDMRQNFLERLQARGGSPASEAKNGILLDQAGVLISRPESMDWQLASASGIWAKPLFTDPRTHSVTSLVRMDPGVHYPPHRHAGAEEVFLLSGDLNLEGQSMKSGDYCHAETGSVHGESYTKSGCLFILRASEFDEVLI